MLTSLVLSFAHLADFTDPEVFVPTWRMSHIEMAVMAVMLKRREGRESDSHARELVLLPKRDIETP